MYIYLLKPKDQYFVLCQNEKPHQIMGFDDEKTGIDYFSDAYRTGLDKGEDEMLTALSHFIFFRPRLVQVDDSIDLTTLVNMDQVKQAGLSKLEHPTGICLGWRLSPYAIEMYEKASDPPAITQHILDSIRVLEVAIKKEFFDNTIKDDEREE